MAQLTVLRDPPPKPSPVGPFLVGFLGVSTIMLGVGVLIIGGAWWWHRVQRQRWQTEMGEHESWIQSVHDRSDDLNATDDLPQVGVGVNLGPGEVCHWTGRASWYEFRKITKRIDYHGVTVSVPIAKGIRYRMGSIAPSAAREDRLVPIDDGVIYVTSKRLFFDGNKQNTSIPWRNLPGIQLFQGGLILDKSSGKDAHLMIERDAEGAALLMARLAG